MSQSLSNVLIHLIFSTKNRSPLIAPGIEKELWDYMGGTCSGCGCPVQRVRGMPDHVHIACALGRTLSQSELLKKIKIASSKWMKAKGVRPFAWQNGYGAFSIGQSQLGDLVQYIVDQKEHHRHRTFQEEFRAFLEKYKIPYDERYVWD